MSFSVDLKNQYTSGISLTSAAARSASNNGTGVDCLLADGPIHIHYLVGAITGSPTSVVLTVEESDASGSGYAAITNQSTDGTVDVTAGSVSGFLTLKHRSKRYVRVVHTITGGTSPTTLVTASVIYNKKILGGNGSQL